MAAPSPRRAASAAFLGSVVEYYDLVIYGTASALVFGKLFFHGAGPQVALVLSLATFASGYLVRPLGGLLFGYIGDRRGRRTAVLLTIALMGVATVLVGLLPGYEAIGPLAPVLLVVLRLGQGLAVGGELGGAVLISVEHAPAGKRGFYGSFSTAGAQAGTVLATAVFALVTLLPQAQLESWGWRVPFLGSALIVLVGLLLRYGLEETPDFVASGERARPIRTALTRYPRAILGIVLVMAGMMSIWYVLTIYSLSYAVNTAGVDRTTMLWVITVATFLVVVMNPVWGALSDRVHRGRLLAAGLLVEGGLLAVYFVALDSRSVPFIFGALLAVAGLGHAAANGIFPAFIVDCLPTEVRYTAGSLGMQVAGVIAGFAPLTAVALEDSVFGIWTIIVVCLALCVAGAGAALALYRSRETLPAAVPVAVAVES
ncbi:MHS family MFS transporter [Amycolatopsis sp. NBC_01488]|uniref:MFS transporter n=1 Tax=Amycolatopsis sp. NBC_01488 TaxID=2903563 RepID=UPI002E28274B|nr:MFS transporter [Amycolatopsis sp. NBC_01488]